LSAVSTDTRPEGVLMVKQVFLCAGLLMLPAACFAGEAQPIGTAIQETLQSPPQTVRLPGTALDIVVGTAIEPGSIRVDAKLLTAIVAWLSSNYDLPPIYDPPIIEFVPPTMMAALRHRDVLSDLWSGRQASVGDVVTSRRSSTIVAIYNDADRTIYLPETWTGDTPAELSVLVHEMVHHLQNLAGMRFDCPEAREKLAYAAQRDWLELFGHSLFTDFETDPFTLLVRTECMY
jgi:Domain of unknown function (DUF6647)